MESSPRKFEISSAAVDEAPALVQPCHVDGLSVSQHVTVVRSKSYEFDGTKKGKDKERKKLRKQEL